MEKVWIVMVDNIDGFKGARHGIAYRNEEDAKDMYESVKSTILKHFDDEIKNGTINYNESEHGIEVYADNYIEKHHSVFLYCLDVR